MSLIAILLVAVSAIIHAAWNLLGKKEHPNTSFFCVANMMGLVMLLPFMIIHRDVIFHGIPPRVWGLLAVSGASMTVYYAGLAGAYRGGDMSLAYPLARSSPVIVVMVVTLFLGRIDQVSAQCIIGVCLVVGGCFLLPMRQFGEFRMKNYINSTCLLAFLAAWGTTGYSISDDEALRILRSAPTHLDTVRVTFLYLGLEAIAAFIFMMSFLLVRKNGRRDLARVFKTRLRHAVAAGIGIYAAYALVLIALAFVRNVSYVVAFRQLSILIGTGLGIMVLKEPARLPKIVGVIVMFAGLILVGLG